MSLLLPNVTHATSCYGKKTDLEVFEQTMWEKEVRLIWWSGNKKITTSYDA